jgi:hypothetical protein
LSEILDLEIDWITWEDNMKECVPEPLWVVESPTKRKYGGRVARSCLRVVDAKDGREKKATARIGCCRIILEIWKKKKNS